MYVITVFIAPRLVCWNDGFSQYVKRKESRLQFNVYERFVSFQNRHLERASSIMFYILCATLYCRRYANLSGRVGRRRLRCPRGDGGGRPISLLWGESLIQVRLRTMRMSVAVTQSCSTKLESNSSADGRPSSILNASRYVSTKRITDNNSFLA